jgi:hypothetical protein
MILYNPTVSGSLLVTGSLTTTGTITSQTLVVQTITSSIEFVTGSTRNGSLAANTHEFTGSVSVSGSVGIGTNTPEGVLTIKGTSAQPPSSGTTANSLLQLVGSLGAELNIGSNTVTGGYGSYIQASDNNLAVSYPLNLQPNGGNVGIGITSPSDKLNVVVGSNGNVARFDGPTSGIIFQTNATTTDIISYGGTTPSYRTLNFAAGASTSMAITTAGVVTRPFQPFAMGALSTDQSIPLSTFTVLNFRTDSGFYGVNTNSCWNNSTYTFTAPVTGVYLVNVSLLTNSVGQVALHVNGTRKHSIPSWYVSSSVTWGGSAMIPLTAGEALTLQGYGNAGTLTANVYHTWFAIYLL